MNVIIAAGGTAGHINPGLAIAEKIREATKIAPIKAKAACKTVIIRSVFSRSAGVLRIKIPPFSIFLILCRAEDNYSYFFFATASSGAS